METIHENNYVIEKMTPDDYDAASEMRRLSWLDTYINEDFGITAEWIIDLQQKRRNPEVDAARKARLTEDETPDRGAYVAKDTDGNVIGAATPYRDENGVQHVGSLYVDKAWQGKGVGGALMQLIIDWSDLTQPIVLSVASYNERAKAFYRKWGFTEIPDSEEIHHEKIPVIGMTRKGDKQ